MLSVLRFAAAVLVAVIITYSTLRDEPQRDTAPFDDRFLMAPSPNLVQALREVVNEAETLSASGNTLGAEIPEVVYNGVGSISQGANETSSWAAVNIVFLKLDPELSQMEVMDLLADYELAFDSAYPELGVIGVRTDLGDEFSDDLTVDEWLETTVSIITRFTSDPRILTASPEIGVSPANGVTIDPNGLTTLDWPAPFRPVQLL